MKTKLTAGEEKKGGLENRFVATKDKKKALFIRGYQGQDVLAFLKEEFGELKKTKEWKVSRREGQKGPTYAIICDSEESTRYILNTRKDNVVNRERHQ